MTPQEKWYGHSLDIKKTVNQGKTNHKIPKAQNFQHTS